MTCCIILMSVGEIVGSMIPSRRGPSRTSLSPMALTTCGWTSVPPFISPAYAVASWIGVTATPWPNAPLARSISRHLVRAGSRTMPPTSPARSIPVGSPYPSRIHMS